MTDEWEDFTDPDLEEPITVSAIGSKISGLKEQVDKQEKQLEAFTVVGDAVMTENGEAFKITEHRTLLPENNYYAEEDEPQSHEYHDLLNELGITISQPPDPASEQAEAWADFLTTRYLNADAEARRAAESAEARKKRLEREKAAILWVHGAWLDSYVRARMSGRAKSVYVGTALLGVEKDRQSGRLVIKDQYRLLEWAEEEAQNLISYTINARGKTDVWHITKVPLSTIPEECSLCLTIPTGGKSYAEELLKRDLVGTTVIKSVSLEAAEKYHKQTKQVPPGCEWIPPQDKLYVRNPRK